MSFTYEEFKKHVDTRLQKFCGMTSEDLADAAWMDLYKECDGGLPSDARIFETQAEYDDLFAALLQERGLI